MRLRSGVLCFWIVCCSLLIMFVVIIRNKSALSALNMTLVREKASFTNERNRVHNTSRQLPAMRAAAIGLNYSEMQSVIRPRQQRLDPPLNSTASPAQSVVQHRTSDPQSYNLNQTTLRNEKFHSTLALQERRLQQLRDTCSTSKTTPESETPEWHEMYVDDQRRYIYCLVSKASCTSWKRTLMMLTGNITEYKLPEQLPIGFVHYYQYSDKFIKRMAQYSKTQRQYLINNYYKFMFVREPLERLVSAYRDKIISEAYWRLDQEILERYRGKQTLNSSSTKTVKPKPTFTEFVRYVLDEWSQGKNLDRHWKPQNELCRPCRIRYDFVGHQETLHADADYVLTRLKETAHRNGVMTANITFPADSGHSKSGPLVEKMYSEVPSVYVQRLFELYAADYELFSFKRPNITGSAAT